MNCPRCGSKMEEKEKSVITKDTDGVSEVKTTERVLYCRDCKVSSPIKQVARYN